jgi:hypothetical protein
MLITGCAAQAVQPEAVKKVGRFTGPVIHLATFESLKVPQPARKGTTGYDE